MQCLQTSCLTNDTESSGLDGVELSQVCWRHAAPNKRAIFHNRLDKSLVNCSAPPAVQHRCRLTEEVEPLVGANGGAMKMLGPKLSLLSKVMPRSFKQSLVGTVSFKKEREGNRRGLHLLVIDICWDFFCLKSHSPRHTPFLHVS